MNPSKSPKINPFICDRKTTTANNPGRLSQRETMLMRHMPLVKIIVAKMRAHLPAHADFEELHSAGIIGLISAIDRFDPSLGYTFETYASIRVRGAILDELRKLDMMPRSARGKLRELNRAVGELEQKLGRAPTDNEICREMGIKEEKFRKMRAMSAPISLICLDQPCYGENKLLHESIADERQPAFPDKLEEKEIIELIANKIQELPDQQKKVLALNYFEEMRLSEIGRIMGVSEARVSQIRSQALARLQCYVRRLSY